MATLLYRRKRKIKTDWQKTLRSYFDRLEEKKKKKVVDVAHDLKLSFASVNAWKYGQRRPRPMIVDLLEWKYGLKIGPLN